MTVRFEARGHVGIITIDRPEARNAIDRATAEGIEEAVDRLEDDDDLWVGVLTGAPPVFCAGADLRVVAEEGIGHTGTARGGFAGLVRRVRDTPLVAAVNGPALAGGFELVLACDLVVASREARFGLPEVRRALVAGAGGLVRLPFAVPRNIAMEIALTGEPIDAATAARLGLVNQMVEPDEVLDAAVALAERVCAGAPLAVRRSRQVLLTALDQGPDAAWEASAQGLRAMAETEDFVEGPKAFLEKRPPNWKGR
ncbi:MAG TPA: crotonase/enoyl-CoA hydratase family protein [Acidimicrobiales bacterium]